MANINKNTFLPLTGCFFHFADFYKTQDRAINFCGYLVPNFIQIG